MLTRVHLLASAALITVFAVHARPVPAQEPARRHWSGDGT